VGCAARTAPTASAAIARGCAEGGGAPRGGWGEALGQFASASEVRVAGAVLALNMYVCVLYVSVTLNSAFFERRELRAYGVVARGVTLVSS